MAHGPSAPYPAGAGTTTARDRRFSTPHQGTPASAPPAANEPISSDSYLSSSPSPRTTSLLSDHTTDLRSTTPHMNRLPISLSWSFSVHSVPGSAALSTPTPWRSPSSSLPRAHDMDQHHQQQQQQQQHHDRGRSTRPTTLQRVATGFRRLTRSSDVPAVSEEDDWSVFGEAMAHEGVQPQPHPQSQLPPPPPSPPGVVPTSHVLVSTPVSDAHIEDFIPSVEGLARVREGEQDEEEEGRSSFDTGLLASSRSRVRVPIPTWIHRIPSRRLWCHMRIPTSRVIKVSAEVKAKGNHHHGGSACRTCLRCPLYTAIFSSAALRISWGPCSRIIHRSLASSQS